MIYQYDLVFLGGKHMAKRQIRLSTDEVLRKTCKPVKEITKNTLTLLDDMAETMYDANGVGLARNNV